MSNKIVWRALASAVAVVVMSSSSVVAQPDPSAAVGRATFATYCASCHGVGGHGDGPLASLLNKKPADLTLIAKRNHGTYPADRVARTIDGRSPAKGHGGGDMPVWGDAFSRSAADATPPEEKIRRLVSYLETVQVR